MREGQGKGEKGGGNMACQKKHSRILDYNGIKVVLLQNKPLNILLKTSGGVTSGMGCYLRGPSS